MPSNLYLPTARRSAPDADSSRGFDKGFRRSGGGGAPGGGRGRVVVILGVLAALACGALAWAYFARAPRGTTASSRAEQTVQLAQPAQQRPPPVPVKIAAPVPVAVVKEAVPPPAAAVPREAAAPDPALRAKNDGRRRTVVLYTAAGRINTGVWPSWGGEPPTTATLNWAAAGVRVEKSCPWDCAFVHDDARLETADAVIVEGVNWPKFGYAGQPLPLPPRSRGALPVRGYFGYEPSNYFPQYGLGDAATAAEFDFAMTYAGATPLAATLPITLVCPWGRAVRDFVAPPPAKPDASKLVLYFSEHGVAPEFRALLDDFAAAAGANLHAFIFKKNRDLPEEASGNPFALENRVAFASTYRFYLITEAVAEADFLSAEWSQAILAGAVPIYVGGPPNLAEYALPGGFIDARTFASGAALWEYVSAFAAGKPGADDAYARFFAWKRGAAAAHAADEPGGDGVLGTGAGVAADACAGDVGHRVAEWPTPVPPGAPTISEDGLDALAADAWRCFRRALDSCVHYAECRACRHVHQIT
jgi:hypothetical protein